MPCTPGQYTEVGRAKSAILPARPLYRLMDPPRRPRPDMPPIWPTPQSPVEVVMSGLGRFRMFSMLCGVAMLLLVVVAAAVEAAVAYEMASSCGESPCGDNCGGDCGERDLTDCCEYKDFMSVMVWRAASGGLRTRPARLSMFERKDSMPPALVEAGG